MREIKRGDEEGRAWALRRLSWRQWELWIFWRFLSLCLCDRWNEVASVLSGRCISIQMHLLWCLLDGSQIFSTIIFLSTFLREVSSHRSFILCYSIQCCPSCWFSLNGFWISHLAQEGLVHPRNLIFCVYFRKRKKMGMMSCSPGLQ